MTLSALAKPVPQRGFSLVGIMVGMLLSMISILTALVLYRTMVHTSVGSRIDATIDGQMASAMSILQMELQSAGFGYPSTGSVLHVFLEPGGAPTYLYWRYLDTGNVPVCRGFRAIDDGATVRKLELLKSTTCDSTSLLSSFTWEQLSELAKFTVLSGQNLPEVRLAMVADQCFPYGMSPKAEYPQVTITIDNAARRAALDDTSTAPNNAFRYSFCLSNIGSISL